MGVPQNRWFIRENPIKVDDKQGYPHDYGHPHMLMVGPVDVLLCNSEIFPEVFDLTRTLIATWRLCQSLATTISMSVKRKRVLNHHQ